MQKLIEAISEHMSRAAAAQGVEIHPRSLHASVSGSLDDLEMVLSRDVIASITPREWAVCMSHARKHELTARDIVMDILFTGISRSADVAMGITRKQAMQKKLTRPPPKLTLVKKAP